MLERLALFSLSASIALVDLAVALFVAAYMGVIPKDRVQSFMRQASQAPLIGRFVSQNVTVPEPAKTAVRRKAASTKKAK